MAISGTDWLEVPIQYIRPIFEAYVREYPHNSYGLIWYSTSILGSWNSHWNNENSFVTPKDTPHRFGHTATPGIPKHVKALLKKFETSRNLHNFPKNAYILFWFRMYHLIFPKHHHTFQTKIETKQCKNKKHNPTESKTVKTSFEFLHNSWKHWKQNITHHYKSLQYSNNNGGFSMFWNHGPTLQKTKMFQEYLSLWRIPKNPQSYS